MLKDDTTTIKVKIEYTRQQIADMTRLRVETGIRVMRNLFDKTFHYRKGESFLLNDLNHKILWGHFIHLQR
jgi:hypothetical protein